MNPIRQTVYKVTDQWDNSVVMHDASWSLSVKYKEGKLIKPKAGLLLVFLNLDHALNFNMSMSGYEYHHIWQCIGYGLREVTMLCDPWKLSLNDVERFWHEKIFVGDIIPPPGTFGCKSLRLIKQIK